MKKVLLIVVPLLLVVGCAYVAAVMGFVKVPGITPKDYGKPAPASENPAGSYLWTIARSVQNAAAQVDAQKKALSKDAPVIVDNKVSKPDAAAGNAKLATVWNDLDV
jgi:hypothetical protein